MKSHKKKSIKEVGKQIRSRAVSKGISPEKITREPKKNNEIVTEISSFDK